VHPLPNRKPVINLSEDLAKHKQQRYSTPVTAVTEVAFFGIENNDACLYGIPLFCAYSSKQWLNSRGHF